MIWKSQIQKTMDNQKFGKLSFKEKFGYSLDDEGNAKDSKIQFKEVFGIGLAWSF